MTIQFMASTLKRIMGSAIVLAIAMIVLLCGGPVFAGESLQNRQLGYSAYFPSQKEGVSEKLPVLVTLPGYGIKADQDINLWAFSAEKKGLVTVSVDMDYDRLHRIGDAERQIEAILEEIGKSRSIDPNRVVIAGTAVGGMLAISLGLRFPEKYLAVAVAGGGSLKAVDWGGLTNARKQTFFMIHGGQNKFVSIAEFDKSVKTLKQYGGRVKSEVFADADESLPAHAYDQLISELSAHLVDIRPLPFPHPHLR